MSDTSKTSRLSDIVYKAPSPIHGHGLFAKVDIPAGAYIGSYEGPPARRNGRYVLWVYQDGADAPPIGRSGRNLLRWLNHRSDGNAEFDSFDLYAKRDISAGEEITFDYGWDESE